MTFDEAEAIAYNPRIRSPKRLIQAAMRLMESGRPEAYRVAERARDRAQRLAAAQT